LHVTKKQLTEIIKIEITNYLLLEKDLTQVKDPRTLSKADRAKRAEQMRAKREKDLEAAKKKPKSFFDKASDFASGFFTDVESEEDTAERDYAGRKKDADELEKEYGAKAASMFSVDVGKTEKEVSAAHRKKIGDKSVGAGVQTDVRNYYYNFMLARMLPQAYAFGRKFLGFEPKGPIRKIIEKRAKGLALRLAAKAGVSAVGGPLAPKLLIALTAAEMVPFGFEIQQDVTRYYKGQRWGLTGTQIKNLRKHYLFPLRKLIKQKGPKWVSSSEAGRVRTDYLASFNDDGYMDIVRDYRAGGSVTDVEGVDEQLPEYAIRILNLINKLGPKKKRRNPFVNPKKQQDKLKRVDKVASKTADKPKEKKLTRKKYKRKFWSILKKAGERFGKDGTWKGLNSSHPARVAYRNYARVGKPVPSGIKSELKSMGLLT